MHTGEATYFEPFFGSGAVFFGLCPARAVLSDNQALVIKTHKAIRDNPEKLIAEFQASPKTKAEWLRRVNKFERGEAYDPVDFLFFVTYGWKSLYRINKKGKYNAPPRIDPLDESMLDYRDSNLAIDIFEASKLLRATFEVGCGLFNFSFEEIRDMPRRGDFVYFDPPYLGTQWDYMGGFPSETLSELTKELDARGVYWILSNNKTPEADRLFGNGFTTIIESYSNMSSDLKPRHLEVLYSNFKPQNRLNTTSISN